MPSHHARRGLAATAVAALTLSGLALAPLSPAGAAADPGLRLMTPYNQARAISFDSERVFSGNAAVRLVAEVGATEDAITFEWNADPAASQGADGWTTISDPVRVSGGFASVDWRAGPGQPAGGSTIAIRVASTPSAGEPTYAVRRNVLVGGGEDPVTAVDLDADISLGYFVQRYGDVGRTGRTAAVTGATSASQGSVQLSGWRSETGRFEGISRAKVVRDPSKAPDEPADYEFAKVLDLTTLQPAEDKTVALGAELGSDHVEPLTLYRQQAMEVRAFSSAGRQGEDVDVSVAVYDQQSRPVAGAEVFRAASGSTPAARVGFTDTDGEITVPQRAGSRRTYYVNTTANDAFEAGTDPTTGAYQVPRYTPEPTSVDARLADGNLFDVDEFSPGDVAVEVLDQERRPVGAGEQAEYRVTPVDSSPGEWQTGTTDDDGRITVVSEVDPEAGEWRLEYRLPGDDSSSEQTFFQAGQARLLLTRDQEATPPSGGVASWAGRLEIDGRPLTGRLVDLDYRRGVENVPGREADAGIVTEDGLALSHQVRTDLDGRFLVRVRDRVERGDPAELGGRLGVSTGDNVPDADSTLSGNAGARVAQRVDFGSGKGSVTLDRSGAGNGRGADEVTVTGPASVAGEKVRFVRVGAGGARTEVAVRRLDARGDRTVSIDDRNGTRTTTYVVELVESARVQPTETSPIGLR